MVLALCTAVVLVYSKLTAHSHGGSKYIFLPDPCVKLQRRCKLIFLISSAHPCTNLCNQGNGVLAIHTWIACLAHMFTPNHTEECFVIWKEGSCCPKREVRVLNIQNNSNHFHQTQYLLASGPLTCMGIFKICKSKLL